MLRDIRETRTFYSMRWNPIHDLWTGFRWSVKISLFASLYLKGSIVIAESRTLRKSCVLHFAYWQSGYNTWKYEWARPKNARHNQTSSSSSPSPSSSHILAYNHATSRSSITLVLPAFHCGMDFGFRFRKIAEHLQMAFGIKQMLYNEEEKGARELGVYLHRTRWCSSYHNVRDSFGDLRG